MHLDQVFLIVGSGILAGAINAMAGGASFMTLPVLVFCGLPSTSANETSTVALWPGTLASFSVYRQEIAANSRFAVMMTVVSVIGGTLGAWILLHTTPLTFDRLLPWLTLSATLIFATGRRLGEVFKITMGEDHDRRAWLKAAPLLSIIAIYSGYYGAGAGIIMLAVLAVLGMKNIHAMNGLKMLGNAASNSSAVVMFAAVGTVDWPATLYMMAGAYGGAALARRLPQQFVRRFVIVMGLATTVYFFYRLSAPEHAH